MLPTEFTHGDPLTLFRFSPNPNEAARINWLPWGGGAFEKAQAEHKPVLLSVSAVWCYWCHVMDETTYSDPDVIKFLDDIAMTFENKG